MIPNIGMYMLDVTKMASLDEGLVIRVETNDDEVKLYLSKQLGVRMTQEQFNSLRKFFENHK